jgi:hypothetical protein
MKLRNLSIFSCSLLWALCFICSSQAWAQNSNTLQFGFIGSVNYGSPQIEATITDQLGYVTEYNSLYSAGFGASLGGMVLVPLGKKTGLRTGLGAEWRNYRYASTGSFGTTDNAKEYYHNFYLLNIPALFQIKPTQGFAIELGPELNMAFAQNLEQSPNALVEPDIFKPEVLANLGIQFRLAGNSYLGLNARWGLTALGTYSGTFGQSNEYTTSNMKFLHRGVSLTYYYIFE